MKTCVIVVDAWEKCLFEDTNKFPFWQQECNAFAKFLQIQLCQIKNKFSYHIYHLSWDPITRYIDLFDGNIYDKQWQLNLNKLGYENIFFCGFHLFSCVKNSYKSFLKITKNKQNNVAIVYNLSLIKPGGTFVNTKYKYVYYTHKLGFSRIKVELHE